MIGTLDDGRAQRLLVRAGSAGLTYVLGYHGQRLIRPDRRARTPDGLGDRYVAHTLAVADVAVGLRERSRSRVIDELDVAVEPDCWRQFPTHRRTVVLKPDLFVSVAVGADEHRWFVEVDLATESLVRVRSKCQTYLDYFATGIETDLHGVFPKVAWVVPDDRRHDQVARVIAAMPAPASEMFTVTIAATATDTLSVTSTGKQPTPDGIAAAGEVTPTTATPPPEGGQR